MIEIEPKSISLQNVRLQHCYTSSVCLTNPLSAPVDLHIRTSSPVLTVQPTKVHLGPSQSLVLTVKVTLSHVPKSPNYYVQIKSIFFDQKIPVDITLAQMDRRSRSPSPSRLSSGLSETIGKETSYLGAAQQSSFGIALNNSSSSSSSAVGDSRGKSTRSPSRDREGAHMIRELNMQLESKDEKIRRLEDMVGQLESKNPNFENILRHKLDEQKKTFEDKSAKILAILRKKDDKIDELKSEVEKQQQTIEGYRHRQDQLEETLNRTGHVSDSEKQPSILKKSTKVESTASHRELLALREKAADQSEQIQVLIEELSKVKTVRKDTDQQLTLSQSEVAQLRREVDKLHRKIKTMQVTQQAQQQSDADDTKENKYPAYEVQAEGGVATATPHNFKLRPTQVEKEAQRLGEEAEARYRALVEDLEQRCQSLQKSLKESLDDKTLLSTKVNTLESNLMKVETDNQLLRDRIHNQHDSASNREYSYLGAQYEERKGQYQSSEPTRTPELKMKDDETNAHQWWSYVWHMLSSKHQGEQALRRISGTIHPSSQSTALIQPGDFGFDTDATDEVTMNLHILKLKENIRLQAIELSNTRQEILGLKLKQRRENDELRQKLELAQRDNVRLAALMKHKSAEKETKLAEMAATIKVLSGRSELHVQLAGARSEVEVEKLASLQLRMELDDRQHELITTQRRLQVVQEEVARLRGFTDSIDIINSFSDIPAVNAATALELVADEVFRCRSQVETHLKELHSAKEQVELLQRQLVHTQQQLQVAQSTTNTNSSTKSSSNLKGKSIGESSSPSVSSKFGTTSMAASRARSPISPRSSAMASSTGGRDQNDLLEDDGTSTYMRPSPASHMSTGGVSGLDDMSELDRLVVDETTTPKILLQSLDVVAMRNRIALQNTTVAQLREELRRFLELKPLTDDSYRSHNLEVLTTEEFIELQNRSKKLDVVSLRQEETMHDLEKARQENLELQRHVTELSRGRLDMLTSKTTEALIVGKEQSSMHDLFPISATNTSSSSVSMLVDLLQDYSQDLPANLRDRFEEVLKELEQKDRLLKDRTSQLKVLMDSFDALQMTSSSTADISDMLSGSNNGKKKASAGLSGLEALAYDDSGNFLNPATNNGLIDSTPKPWIIQPLVKRVIELTVQTSSLLAQTDLDGQRLTELEHQLKASQRLTNKLQAKAHKLETTNAQMAVSMQGMKDELRTMDENKIQSAFEKNQDFTNLVQTLQETEAQLQDKILEIEELKQLNHALSSKDEEWILQQLRGIFQTPMGNIRPLLSPTSPAPHSPSLSDFVVESDENRATENATKASNNVVAQLLQEYLQRLRDNHHDGNHPPITIIPPKVSTFASVNASVARVSKYEQRFYQRISDLVVSASKSAAQAERLRLSHEQQNALLSEENTQLRSHLVAFAQRLYSVRKQCVVYEQLVRQSRLQGVTKQSRLIQQLRGNLTQEKKQSKLLSMEIMTLRRKVIGLTTAQHWASRSVRKQQAVIAVLESKGTSYLQAKEDVQRQMHDKMESMEKSFRHWFRSELPRLVAGVPIIEEAFSQLPLSSIAEFNALSGNNNSASNNYQGGNNHMPSITERLMQQSGVDRNFSLATALCAAKAEQVATQATADELRERLRLQKERTTALEGVILKWRETLEKKSKQALVSHRKSIKRRKQSSKKLARHGDHEEEYGNNYGDREYLVDQLDEGSEQDDEEGNEDEEEFPSQTELDELFRKERALLEMNEALAQRVQTLEEDVIEAQGRLAQSDAGHRLAQKMLDQTYAEAEEQKTRSMQQMSRVRTDLERQHAEELRSLREVYEKERDVMMRELHTTSQLVDEEINRPNPGLRKSTNNYDGFFGQDGSSRRRRQRSTADEKDDSDDDNYDFDEEMGGRPKYDSEFEVLRRQPMFSRRGDNEVSNRDKKVSQEEGLENSPLARPIVSLPKPESRRPEARGDSATLVDLSDDHESYDDAEREEDTFDEQDMTNNNNNETNRPKTSSSSHRRTSSSDMYDSRAQDELDDAVAAMTKLSDTSSASSVSATMRMQQVVSEDHRQRQQMLQKRRLREAQNEIRELRKIVSRLKRQHQDQTQLVSQLQQQQQQAQQTASSRPSSSASSSTAANDNVSMGVKRMVDTIVADTSKESPSLWPSLATLTTELTDILTTLAQRLDDDSDLMDLVKASVAMSQRIQLSARHFPTQTSSNTSSSNPVSASGNADNMLTAGDNMMSNEAMLPERYQFLLRDLRHRLTEMESTYQQQLQEERMRFASERAELIRSKDEATALAQEVTQSQVTHHQQLKERYESALEQAQETLTSHSATLKQELQKLEDRAALLSQQLAQEKEQRQRLQMLYDQQQLFLQTQRQQQQFFASQQQQQQQQPSNNANNNAQPMFGHNQSAQNLTAMFDMSTVENSSMQTPPSNNSNTAGKGQTGAMGDDFVSLQRQLTATQDELETSRRQHRQASSNFQSEVAELKEDFERYRMAHETIVRSLEEQLEESQSLFSSARNNNTSNNQNNLTGGPDASILSQSSWSMHVPSLHPPMPPSAASVVSGDLELQLQRLTYKYNMKCAEFDALLKMATARGEAASGGQSADNSPSVPVVPAAVVSETAKELRQQMQSVRLVAAETEVERLRRDLRREMDGKRVIQEQLQRLAGTSNTSNNANTASHHKPPRGKPSSSSAAATAAAAPAANYDDHDDFESDLLFVAETTNTNNNNNSSNSGANNDGSSSSTAIVNTLLKEFSRDAWVLPARLSQDNDAQMLLRRANTLRRRVLSELKKLQEAIAVASSTTTEDRNAADNANTTNNNVSVQQQIKQWKAQVNQLKEDIQRKNKVIAALKEAKVSDANALEQWKNETHALEDAHRRLQRAIAAKDAVVKDLRSKVETLEASAQLQQQNQHNNQPINQQFLTGEDGHNDQDRTGDIYLLGPQELRSRLKEYDLERARYRARMQAFKDKIQELDTQITTLTQENEALKKIQDKLQESKVIIARKESLILSLRNQLDIKQKEIEQLQQQDAQHQQDAERRIRSLQRQVDAALRQQQDFERETTLLRQRVTQAVEQDKRREFSQRAGMSSSSASTAGGFHFSLQGQQAPMVASPPPNHHLTAAAAAAAAPTAATRMQRAVAFAPTNTLTQRLSDVSRSLLPNNNNNNNYNNNNNNNNSSSSNSNNNDHNTTAGHSGLDALYRTNSGSSDELDDHHANNSNRNNSANNNNRNNNNYNSSGANNTNNTNTNDVEALLMQTLGLQPATTNNNSSNSNNNNNNSQNSNNMATTTTANMTSVGGTTDLLARLTGLSHLLPPASSSSYNNDQSVMSDNHNNNSDLNLSSTSSTQNNHNNNYYNNNNNSNTSMSSSDASSSSLAAQQSSAEKRLQALVDAALMSPGRK